MKQKIIFETTYPDQYSLYLLKVYEEADRLVVLMEQEQFIGVCFGDNLFVAVSVDVELQHAKKILPVAFYVHRVTTLSEEYRLMFGEASKKNRSEYFPIDEAPNAEKKLDEQRLEKNAVCLFDGKIKHYSSDELLRYRSGLFGAQAKDWRESRKLSNRIISTLTCGLFGRSEQFLRQEQEQIFEMQENRFSVLAEDEEGTGNYHPFYLYSGKNIA